MKKIILIGMLVLVFLVGCSQEVDVNYMQDTEKPSFVGEMKIIQETNPSSCQSEGVLWQDFKDCFTLNCSKIESNTPQWEACTKRCMGI